MSWFLRNFPESSSLVSPSFEELGEILSLARLIEVDHQEQGKRLLSASFPQSIVFCVRCQLSKNDVDNLEHNQGRGTDLNSPGLWIMIWE